MLLLRLLSVRQRGKRAKRQCLRLTQNCGGYADTGSSLLSLSESFGRPEKDNTYHPQVCHKDALFLFHILGKIPSLIFSTVLSLNLDV